MEGGWYCVLADYSGTHLLSSEANTNKYFVLPTSFPGDNVYWQRFLFLRSCDMGTVIAGEVFLFTSLG